MSKKVFAAIALVATAASIGSVVIQQPADAQMLRIQPRVGGGSNIYGPNGRIGDYRPGVMPGSSTLNINGQPPVHIQRTPNGNGSNIYFR